MKRLNILLAGMLMFALAGITKIFADETAIAQAQKTFQTKCAMCHAVDGKGKAVMAKNFKISPTTLDLTGKEAQSKTDAELITLITNGKNKMPAYGKQFNPEAIKGLVAHVRSLAAK